VGEQALREHFGRLREAISRTVDAMPDHAAFIEQHVKAPAMKVTQ
jgi:tryptophan halogenase